MVAPVWERAPAEALAAFDPSTKQCTMNCGRSLSDPRSDNELKFLCPECIQTNLENPSMRTTPNKVAVRIMRASGSASATPPALYIEAVTPIPSDRLSLAEARSTYQADGTALADALLASLPGGTVDVLLGELMRRRASLFAVPLEG